MTQLVQVAAAPVTDWPQRLALTVLMGILVITVLGLMRWGWVRRAGRQSDVAPLPAAPPAPAVADEHVGAPVWAKGRYLGATRTGDWLDRIVVHGLGVPSKARLVASEQGLWILRDGAPDLFIAAGDVAGVRHDRAGGGRVLEADGVLLITWNHGGTLIDIGLRVPDAVAAECLRSAIEAAARDTRHSSSSLSSMAPESVPSHGTQTSPTTNQGDPA